MIFYRKWQQKLQQCWCQWNSLIKKTEIEFSGSVDSLSLPQGGVALGAINITSTDGATATPAAGSFGVSDAPGGAPGNSRLVTFLPTPPTDPANPASTAGLGGNLAYTVFIPRTGNTTQVVNVGGGPLQNEAVAAFLTCDPNAPAGPQACFTDPQPGPPHVVMTIAHTAQGDLFDGGGVAFGVQVGPVDHAWGVREGADDVHADA